MMKCTHGEAVSGLMTLIALRKNEVSGEIAKVFYFLRKKLADAAEFEQEQETQFVEQHGGKISDTGKVTFEEPDMLMQFIEKQNEIRAMEYEYDAPGKYILDPAKCGRITEEQMEILEPFIDWKE